MVTSDGAGIAGGRGNPMSDKFDINGFHHIEFWTSDAITLCKRHAPSLYLRV